MALFRVKKNKLWLWKALDRDSGRLLDWELGGRDRETLRRMLERLSRWEVTHWEAYAAELDAHPDRFHVATKAETVNIERNNSDNRRWLSIFQRKSKVVSKSLEMVDLSMALFAKSRVKGSITLLRNWRL